MKKSILIIVFSLVTTLCAGFAGCDLLSGLGHTHTPSNDWQGDATYHWHQCTDDGCSEKLDKTQHTSLSYVTNSDGHYKICTECGLRFDEATHNGEECSICGYIPNHTHTLVHVEAKDADCTTDGNVEYWHCTGCEKNYSDEGATTVLTTVVVGSTGHSSVSKHDEATHWQECEKCQTVLVSAQSHTSSTYIKDKTGHYKICTECGVRFDEGTHSGEECLICGYTPDYADFCSSDYGYNYLGTLASGENLQSFYNAMDEVVVAFHTDETKNATSVTVSGSIAYVAGEVNYSSLGLTLGQAQSVWATYRHDHPLYYWLLGQVVNNSQSLYLCVDSDYKNGSQRAAQNDLIYGAIDGYLTAVQGETSAYYTAFAFHDMIIDSIDYALDEEGNPEKANWAHSILGVLCGESAVCEGYAKAYALLLNASGIDNVYVTGSSKGVGHAWNMVKIDGAWYWYDLTWDDQPAIGSGTIYKYMCQPGETFTDHTVGAIGNTSDPMNFLYALPTAATVEYNTSSLEYGEQFTVNGISYEVCGYNEVSVASSSSSLTGEVVLVESLTYSGRAYTLTQIDTGGFTGNRWITALTIPQSVKVIYNLAFNGCSRLSSVTFEDKTGWSRRSVGGTESVEESSLQSATDAATLLKETYSSGISRYEYTWVKAPAA